MLVWLLFCITTQALAELGATQSKLVENVFVHLNSVLFEITLINISGDSILSKF